MSRRRMFDLDVVTSNKFVLLHKNAQCLYYTLGMNTDDEGFVANPLLIIRGYGFEQCDLKALIESGFVTAFESGIVYINHHDQNNSIRKDRKKPTRFKEEVLLLGKKELEKPKRPQCDIKRKEIYKKSKLPYCFNKKITAEFNGKQCPICGITMNVSNTKIRPTIQHNLPISKGGRHEINNISVICSSCNSATQNRETDKLNNEEVKNIWLEICTQWVQK